MWQMYDTFWNKSDERPNSDYIIETNSIILLLIVHYNVEKQVMKSLCDFHVLLKDISKPFRKTKPQVP